MAIEIADLPIDSMVIFHSYVTVYQRVKTSLAASYTPISQPGASSLIPTDSTGAAGSGDLLICSLVVVGFLCAGLAIQTAHGYLSINLSIYQSIYLSIYLYILTFA